MADNKPLVSIGMPVYNGEHFIRQALDSLLTQDYEDFELIISDNASTDRTQEIGLEYAARDKRIRYNRNHKNLGAAWNFNHVFELASGKYFMWAAHDDLWDPSYIRKCVDVLERTPSAVLCCTSLRFIDEDGRLIHIEYEGLDNPDMSSLDVRERVRILVSRHGWYAIYGVIRSDVLRRTRLVRTVYGCDVVLLMELALLGPFANVPEVLFYYRRFHGRTEKDRAHQVDTASAVKPSYSNLCRELVRTVLISNPRSLTRILLALELVALYLRDPAWRFRLVGHRLHSLRTRLRLRARLGHALEIALRVLEVPRDVYLEWKLHKDSQGLRCALIEYCPYHGEIQPGLVYALNALGVSVDVYASRSVRQNAPFIYASGLRYSLRGTDGLFFKLWVERQSFRDYDIIVFGTLEPKDILWRVTKIITSNIPVITVIHNGSLIKNDPDYGRFFNTPTRVPLVLGEHISQYLSDTLIARWISNINTLDQVDAKRGTEVCFCVQGSVDFGRRNYDSLLDAVEQLLSDGVKNFHVMVVGRNNTQDGLVFKEKLKSKGLNRFFTFSKGELVYKDYYDLVASAHFILPLIDTTRSEYKPYFFEKVTNSISIALSLGIVPIVHKQLACIYGIEDHSVTYEEGGLHVAMKRALSIDEETLERMRCGLISRKKTLLNQSVTNMKDTLKDLGLIFS